MVGGHHDGWHSSRNKELCCHLKKKKKIASLSQWGGGVEKGKGRVKEERIQYTFHLAAVEHYLKYSTF